MKTNKARCKSRTTRREFIGAAASVTAPAVVPRHVLGGPGNAAPSEKLNIAGIGAGGRGYEDLISVSSEEPMGRDIREVRVATRVAPRCAPATQLGNGAHSGHNYVDSLVNMIVVTGHTHVPVEEMTRALCPRGVIADIRKSKAEFTRKDWPAELDEWTYYLHDASNNAVSNDTLVAPPQGLRWTCGPKYAGSHEHFASMSAMVAAGGRIAYIIDEGPISSVFLPPQWKLVAGDAFSGVLLWEKPITSWEAHLRGFRSGPAEIGRRMVATGAGHKYFTFSDPCFRIILLRATAWTMNESFDPFKPLVTLHLQR